MKRAGVLGQSTVQKRSQPCILKMNCARSATEEVVHIQGIAGCQPSWQFQPFKKTLPASWQSSQPPRPIPDNHPPKRKKERPSCGTILRMESLLPQTKQQHRRRPGSRSTENAQARASGLCPTGGGFPPKRGLVRKNRKTTYF